MAEFERKWDYDNPFDVAILASKTVTTKKGDTFQVWEGKDKAHDIKLSMTRSKDGKYLILKGYPKLKKEESEEPSGTSTDDAPF